VLSCALISVLASVAYITHTHTVQTL